VHSKHKFRFLAAADIFPSEATETHYEGHACKSVVFLRIPCILNNVST
jgi:hypothetical protein